MKNHIAWPANLLGGAMMTTGVGEIAGTVIGSLGLGIVSKFLEPNIGPVMAKIFILIFIILFIQKRPQGIFALKGRAADV